MEFIWPILIGIGSFLLAMWATIKYIIMTDIRVDANIFKTLYKIGKDNNAYVISEDFTIDTKYPLEFTALFYLQECPWFILSHSERLLNAGWQSKDYVSKVLCLRWSHKKIRKFLEGKLAKMQIEELGIPVEVITPYFTDKIGSLKMTPPTPYLKPSVYEDFEREIKECLEGKINKTGALFYGPAGNGKTFLIKYLALKYSLPIKIVTFTPDYTNHDLMLLFSQIPPKAIILFEDFDNYFDGRNCIIGNKNLNIKFTFDAILNGLDGIYNSYKENIFIMTVNDIDKVDYALKYRPSRFKFLREIGNPDFEARGKLLPQEWAIKAEGLNLDQVFVMKKFYEEGYSFEEAMERTIPRVNDEKIKTLAQKRYEERCLLGIEGSPNDDWIYAQKKLGLPVIASSQEQLPVAFSQPPRNE